MALVSLVPGLPCLLFESQEQCSWEGVAAEADARPGICSPNSSRPGKSSGGTAPSSVVPRPRVQASRQTLENFLHRSFLPCSCPARCVRESKQQARAQHEGLVIWGPDSPLAELSRCPRFRGCWAQQSRGLCKSPGELDRTRREAVLAPAVFSDWFPWP